MKMTILIFSDEYLAMKHAEIVAVIAVKFFNSIIVLGKQDEGVKLPSKLTGTNPIRSFAPKYD